MKILGRKENLNDEFDFPNDVEKIVLSYKKNGIIITKKQAEEIWLEYSDTFCAGWLMLPKERDEVYNESESTATKIYNIEEI